MNAQACFIDCLPIETLEAIFIHCAWEHHSCIKGGLPTPTAPGWVQVSYVSRRWRDIALNCPTLWSYFFITSPRWTEELLARSKQAPLKLRVDLLRYEDERRGLHFLRKTMVHLERIQELHLRVQSGDQRVFSKLCMCAPSLQKLRISVSCLNNFKLSVPFDGDTPALRTLELLNCPIPWYLLKLSSLTTLSLCNVPVQLRQDMTDFLATLSCMQCLTHLYLKGNLANVNGFLYSTAFHKFQKISFPHLSRFSIIAPISTVVTLLSCINIPWRADTMLKIDGGEKWDWSLDHYSTLVSLLGQRLATSEDQALASPKIRSLAIGINGWREVKLTFSTSEHDHDCFKNMYHLDWGCSIPLQVIFPFDPSMIASDRDHIMDYACCPVLLSNVQRLHVFSPPFSPTFWTHIFGHLPDLRYIKLVHGHMPDLASVLSLAPHDHTDPVSGQADRSPNQISAPALEGLELHDIIFFPGPERDNLKRANVQSLCDALATRTERLGRLSMTQCIECGSDGEIKKVFDMAGWWEGGRFHVFSDKHDLGDY